jgi:hypothetical protein
MTWLTSLIVIKPQNYVKNFTILSKLNAFSHAIFLATHINSSLW